jgi:tRNA A-37 threonylcarbamoyl transferase component Bud32
MIGKIISNYKLISVIGEGGMGVVFLAEHIHFSRQAAVKSLHKKLLANKNIKERFKNEAATLSQIQHPNIVKLYDYAETEYGSFLIMEFVDGVLLDDYIKNESGPIKEDNAIKIMTGLLSGFSYAHSKNIVHRDVKPSNVIISRDFSVVKILDFGIAKILGDDSRNLTKDGSQMGTVYYMSPEQVKGLKLDKRSDIYSLGVTLFQMVTGINPYETHTTEFEIYTKITQEDLPDAKSVYPYVSDKIEYVIKKATRKNVEDRYRSCEEMMNDLNNNQFNVPVLQETPRKQVQQPTQEHVIDDEPPKGKKIGLIAAIVISSLIGLFTLIYFFGGGKEYLKWRNAEVLYAYATSLGMRSDTTTFADFNKLPVNLKFGDSVRILYDATLTPWAEGKFDDITGYVNTNYLISEKDFRLLTGILSNNLTEEILLSKYRKSLLTYFKNNSLTPDISSEEQTLVFGNSNAREKWVLDKAYFSYKLNYIYTRKCQGSRKTDYCIIPIRNVNNSIKKGILFVYENDKEIASVTINQLDPMHYYDYYAINEKLSQYGLYLNANDMYLDYSDEIGD